MLPSPELMVHSLSDFTVCLTSRILRDPRPASIVILAAVGQQLLIWPVTRGLKVCSWGGGGKSMPICAANNQHAEIIATHTSTEIDSLHIILS